MTTHGHVYLQVQHLIFDADDTLWENNIYFERAIERFLDFLAHSTLSRETSARQCSTRSSGRSPESTATARLPSAATLQPTVSSIWPSARSPRMTCARSWPSRERILTQPIELIDGVEETLASLAVRHDLTL